MEENVLTTETAIAPRDPFARLAQGGWRRQPPLARCSKSTAWGARTECCGPRPRPAPRRRSGGQRVWPG
eukprot:13748005-Alexandrium_andersonii.AAC.1